MTLGERVGQLRQERGFGVRDFARQAGISPPFVVDIEADHRLPGPENLAKIAEALGVPLAELQALDPRLPASEGEALRLALIGDYGGVRNMLGGLDDWRLVRLTEAADMLSTIAGELPGAQPNLPKEDDGRSDRAHLSRLPRHRVHQDARRLRCLQWDGSNPAGRGAGNRAWAQSLPRRLRLPAWHR